MKAQSALVTGSTSGIGFGIAKELAKAGCNIMLNGFADAATVDKCKAEIASLGVKVAYHGADVTKPEQVSEMVQATVAAFGRIDVLVNNAGIQHVDSVENFPLERWDAVLSTNLSSCFYSIRAALPLMRGQGFGRIINIASAHGLAASPQKAAYVAAKHGAVGLTKVVALETAGSGITCNAICPGWVLTPLVQKQVDAIAKAEGLDNEAATTKLLSAKQPSKQFVTPEQVGGFVVFLTTPAADQITGAALSVDGGWYAQ